MIGYLVAERYAGALNATLEDETTLDAAQESLDSLAELFQTHHDLHSCLANPAIELENRTKVLDELLNRLEVMGVIKNLAHELLERGRISALPVIAQAFRDTVDERTGRMTADITTALPLSEENHQLLVESLSAYTGKRVVLRCKVDEEVIGGVVAHVGGKIIDGSLRRRLENIKEALIAAPL